MKKLAWLADSRARKKSKSGIATPKSEIELIRQRLKQLRSEVRNAEKNDS
jgi:hypothetical protein